MGLINPDFRTLPELFTSVFSHFKGQSDQAPIARKINGAYVPISYDSLAEDCRQLAAFLKEKGIESGDRVAILSENRPSWYLADMAILSLGAIDVPLYPSLPPNQIEYILNNCGAKGIIVSNMLQLGKILSIWPKLNDMNLVIVMNKLDEPIEDVIELSQAKSEGKKILEAAPGSLTASKPGLTMWLPSFTRRAPPGCRKGSCSPTGTSARTSNRAPQSSGWTKPTAACRSCHSPTLTNVPAATT